MSGLHSGKRNFAPRSMHQDISALKSRTRKIDQLKYSLPGIALVVMLLLIFWPQFRQWRYSHVPTLAQSSPSFHKNSTATHPAYKGGDKNNQPFTISADQGLELSAEEVELTLPVMEMVLKSGDKVKLSASLGTYNKSTNILHLVGNVILTHSKGYCLETGQAWLDCTSGNAYTDNPVWGKGPLGTIHAKGFNLTEKGNKVSFKGGTELFILTSQGKTK